MRGDARETIARLERAGLAPAMVTGDRRAPALAVARAVGLAPARVHAGQSPEDKAARVAESGEATAFVGDGINDGVALAAARVGIAVEGASSVASATAGVAVARGGLGKVVEAVAVARRVRRIMVQNLVFAVVYNAAGLSLAVVGAVPPAAAAAAMAASSLSVLANASRARIAAETRSPSSPCGTASSWAKCGAPGPPGPRKAAPDRFAFASRRRSAVRSESEARCPTTFRAFGGLTKGGRRVRRAAGRGPRSAGAPRTDAAGRTAVAHGHPADRPQCGGRSAFP